MHRRGFLATLGLSLTAVSSGCTGDSFGGDEFATVTEPEGWTGPDRRLGGGASVSLSVEPRGDYEYLSESDSVRVREDSGDTETEPFSDWAADQSTQAALDRVGTRLREESVAGRQVRVGRGSDTDGVELPERVDDRVTDQPFPNPLVNYVHHYSRDGDLISKPEASFKTVVDATPQTVAVTVSIPETTYERVLPVICNRYVLRND